MYVTTFSIRCMTRELGRVEPAENRAPDRHVRRTVGGDLLSLPVTIARTRPFGNAPLFVARVTPGRLVESSERMRPARRPCLSFHDTTRSRIRRNRDRRPTAAPMVAAVGVGVGQRLKRCLASQDPAAVRTFGRWPTIQGPSGVSVRVTKQTSNGRARFPRTEHAGPLKSNPRESLFV